MQALNFGAIVSARVTALVARLAQHSIRAGVAMRFSANFETSPPNLFGDVASTFNAPSAHPQHLQSPEPAANSDSLSQHARTAIKSLDRVQTTGRRRRSAGADTKGSQAPIDNPRRHRIQACELEKDLPIAKIHTVAYSRHPDHRGDSPHHHQTR